MFQKAVVRSCIVGRGSDSLVHGSLAVRDEDDNFVRNVRSSLLSDSPPHLRRQESSIKRLWEFQNPYTIFPFTWKKKPTKITLNVFRMYNTKGEIWAQYLLLHWLFKIFTFSDEKLAEGRNSYPEAPSLSLGKSVGLRDHKVFGVALGGSLFKFRKFDRFYQNRQRTYRMNTPQRRTLQFERQ